MEYYETLPVTEEQFAAWLDGMLTPEEEQRFLMLCANDEAFQEICDANDSVGDDYENMMEEGYFLPGEMMEDFALPEINAEEQFEVAAMETNEETGSYDDSDIADATDDDIADTDITDEVADTDPDEMEQTDQSDEDDSSTAYADDVDFI